MLQVQFLLDRFPAVKPAQVIVRDSKHYPDQLQSALKAVGRDGFDIVLDAVAGEYFQPSYQAMTRGGRHVVFGAANWTPTGNHLCIKSLGCVFLSCSKLCTVCLQLMFNSSKRYRSLLLCRIMVFSVKYDSPQMH